ncbi:hypothetical protein ES754_11455 [Psychrobacter frigidicola]|uniref:Uncharacterized protein n=1 Tax=Psychrobacter frigidicola TaxID=45611 RepID=A0A5C7A358_9GAMM|nr:hypothetical protein [Psychrobacter frigidicola]TXD96242.1 hypothetical protein ES754_11455 [Psychrobacter frigidicola]
MEEPYYRVDKYIDKYTGKNYGIVPVTTCGTTLNDNFKKSNHWDLIEREDSIDKRNDNQCDIHRGSNFIYQNTETGKTVRVFMDRSRNGKTVKWAFCYSFEEQVEF